MVSQSLDPCFVALEGILRIVNGIFTALERLDMQAELRQELARALQEGEKVNHLQLNELRGQYQAFVDRYLAVKQPFHWNAPGRDNSTNTEQDIAQYLELVEFSAFLGNVEILTQWGINVLTEHGGSCCLAESADYYVAAFEFAMNESPQAVKPYLEWLVRQFRQM